MALTSALMTLRAAMAFCLCALSACGREPAPASENRSPATPAVIEIPRATGASLADPANRETIRILVARSRTHFERRADHGLEGRTFDAAVALEAFLNERFKPQRVAIALVETAEDRLIADLLEGKGDIAANLLKTFARDDQVAFATPVRTGIRELVVTGSKQPPLVSLEDVGGRTIHVRRNSDHHASLVRLNEQLVKINRPPAKIALTSGTDEDLLEAVNGGKLAATLVDDYVLARWRKDFPNLGTNRDVAVSQDGELAWVTRKDNPKLLSAMNDFFSTHKLTF